MPDIQFQEQPDEFGRPPQQSVGADLTGKIVAWGFAKDRQQAEYILIGITALLILVGLYFFFSSGDSSAPPLLPQ